jgi:uncharacterized protein (DUF1778 family)
MSKRLTEPIGVRVSEEDKALIDEAAKFLSIPQSVFVRLLLRYSLRVVRENPSKIIEGVSRCQF